MVIFLLVQSFFLCISECFMYEEFWSHFCFTITSRAVKQKRNVAFPVFTEFQLRTVGDRILIASIKFRDGNFQQSKTSGIHTYVSACEPVNGFSSLLLVERLLHDSCLKNSEGRSLAGVNPSAPQGGRAAEKHAVWEVRVCDFMDWRILHRQTSCA